MRFLLDVNLSPKLLWEFQRLGHAAEHVSDAIGKNAKDTEIAQFADRHHAVLVSKDADFVQLAENGLLSTGLIWLRCGNMGARDTGALVRRHLPDALLSLRSGLKIVEIHD